MEDLYSLEAFLREQPQCKELTGDALENAYERWLYDLHREIEAERWLKNQQEREEL